tara:strand:- start:270 stop:527 length:258 start_codon:yes stop_codon:yes gene_type:complete
METPNTYIGAEDPEKELLKEARFVVRKNLAETIASYQAAEKDWNSIARQQVAKEIQESSLTLMQLSIYLDDWNPLDEIEIDDDDV